MGRPTAARCPKAGYDVAVNVLVAAAAAWTSGRAAAMATVIDTGGSAPRSAGARMVVYADGSSVGTIGGGTLEFEVIQRSLAVIASGRPERYAVHLVHDLGMCCGGKVEVFVEPLMVRDPFVLFGAGHVAAALAPLLRALDFQVTVVDAREAWNTEERFIGCDRVVDDPCRYAAALGHDPRAYRLIVTHDHAIDQQLVEALLPLDAAWVGMIGSRRKVARFRSRLRAAGVAASQLDRLRAPVGLDIGAETPAEIAVSIAAELVRHRRAHDRAPWPLATTLPSERAE